MLTRLVIKAASRKGGKSMIKLLETDPSNPLTIDTADVITHVGKAIFHIGKEILFWLKHSLLEGISVIKFGGNVLINNDYTEKWLLMKTEKW